MNPDTARSDDCVYCGLPLPQPLFGARAATADDRPQYCCSGCRFAHAITQERGEAGAASWTLTSLGLAIFFSMSVMVFTIALWSFDVYDPAAEHADMRRVFGGLLAWLALIFSVPVLLLLGKPLLEEAWSALRRGVLSSDLLLMTGVMAAFSYSTWAVIRGEGAVYFETGCVILVFVTLGRWLAATGKLRTSAALDRLQALLPVEVRRVTADGLQTVALEQVALGDELQIQAGERIPIDGVVQYGAATVDEQVFTGESVPVDRQPGDKVFAGTLNLDGTIRVSTTALPRQGAFGALLAAVQSARESKGHYQLAADRITRLFFPIITVIAAATVIGHGLTRGWSAGWLAGLSVVLIACPCALALATPMAVWAALGRAARRGVLFRSGESIERLAEVRAIRWDKTGTLTTGTPRVVDILCAEGTAAEELRRRTSPVVAHSTHIFSQAIARELDTLPKLTASAAEAASFGNVGTFVRTVSGYGVEGTIAGLPETIRAGRWDWVVAGDVSPWTGYEPVPPDTDPTLEREYASAIAAGRSTVAVGWGGEVQGLFLIAEETRPHAAAVMQQLQSAGFDVALLTGDQPVRAARLADELHIPTEAGLSPADKADAIRRARQQIGPTAMIGDGINDAPALAAADVGIALGCGADVTRDSGDVCLLGDDLTAVPWAIDLARETVRTVRGNLAWAFGYNAIGVAFAAAGWLHPAIAAVLMVVSSVVVIARSLRLGHDPAEQPAMSAAPSENMPIPLSSPSETQRDRPLVEAAV